MRQGWQETLLPRELLLLLLLLGTRCWCLVLSQDSDAATPRKLYGDSCTSDGECGFEGSECRLYNGRGKCTCQNDWPVTNHIDKCGRAAAVNESCFFNEQCESFTPETECRNQICQCRFQKQPVVGADGRIECVDMVINTLCTKDSDCKFDGGVCKKYEGYGKCQCAEDLVTNFIDKCGKAAKIKESCSFNEQCEATTPESECTNGICTCRFGKQPVLKSDGNIECKNAPKTQLRRRRDSKILFGDICTADEDCQFEGALCKKYNGQNRCECQPDLVTNHFNKCGRPVPVNETCFFNEQCEAVTPETECKNEVCICRFEKQPRPRSDGKIECVVIQDEVVSTRYVDPAMIGILVAMFLMFITICVVLRLFSKARWRENRTIFNTPNPRLMNVSLLRENKLLHQERRGSRSSARGPSRQPSMASLRAHSPNSQGRLFLGSRRGSRGSSNASATSNRSNKSPPQNPNLSSAATPMLESVTVEVQEPKAP